MNLEPRGLERNGRGCNLRKKVDARLSMGKKKGAGTSNNSKKEKIKENLENGNLNEAIDQIWRRVHKKRCLVYIKIY
jgi:hypothetical protein